MSDDVQGLLKKAEEIEKKQEQAQTTEPAPEPEKEKLPIDYICPVCNHPAKNLMPQANEEDLREFMRSILADKLFTKSYSVGKVVGVPMTWKMQVISDAQSKQMDNIIAQILDDKKMQSQAKSRAIHEVKLLFYVREFADTVYEPPGDDIKSLEAAVELFTERFGSKSELAATMGLRILVTFEQLVAVLTQSVFDESFWQGAGLV